MTTTTATVISGGDSLATAWRVCEYRKEGDLVFLFVTAWKSYRRSIRFHASPMFSGDHSLPTNAGCADILGGGGMIDRVESRGTCYIVAKYDISSRYATF